MAFNPKIIQRAVSSTLNGLSAHRSSALLISTLLALSWFTFKSGPDSFMAKHPGVIFVLVGVVGVVALDFKKIKTRRGVVRFFFDALLILGLILELREASKSDIEVSRLNAIALTASNDAAQALVHVVIRACFDSIGINNKVEGLSEVFDRPTRLILIPEKP